VREQHAVSVRPCEAVLGELDVGALALGQVRQRGVDVLDVAQPDLRTLRGALCARAIYRARVTISLASAARSLGVSWYSSWAIVINSLGLVNSGRKVRIEGLAVPSTYLVTARFSSSSGARAR
jgi:hypothetical protein